MKKQMVMLTLFLGLGALVWGMGQKENFSLSPDALALKSKIDVLRENSFLYTMRDAVTTSKALSDYQALLADINGSALSKPQKDYLSALVYFDEFSIYYDYFPNLIHEKSQEDAYAALLKSDQLTTALLKEGLISSDLDSLQGEINQRMLVFVGMAGGGMKAIVLSNKARKLFEKALALNPKNMRAVVGLGTWYLFAPKIAGGDPRIALKLFDQAEEQGGNYVKLMSMIWKVMLYYSYLNNPEKAKAVLTRALRWIPDHGWLLDFQDRINQGKPLNTGG